MNLAAWFRNAFVTLIVKITPRCVEMTRLISRSMDARLPIATRLRMRLHYLICVWCARYLKQIQFIHDHAGELDAGRSDNARLPKLSDAARNRLRQSINGQR